MTVLSITSIEKLRSLGLLLPDEPFFPGNHCAYPRGYLVMKPIDVQGNSLPSLRKCYDAGYTFDDTDMPVPVVWYAPDGWRVSVWDWVPGPGPGDFVRAFANEAAAVQFVVEYFFHETPEFSVRLAYESQKGAV